MTLNEIISYAKKQKIDFDKPVAGLFILNHIIPFSIFNCSCNFKNELKFEAQLSNDFPICHIDWGYECEDEEMEE